MYEINLKDSNLYLSQFNAGAEVAVVSVVRIDYHLLQNDFRVNHHDAETVFAGRDNRDAVSSRTLAGEGIGRVSGSVFFGGIAAVYWMSSAG